MKGYYTYDLQYFHRLLLVLLIDAVALIVACGGMGGAGKKYIFSKIQQLSSLITGRVGGV
jgi:hypothetical protein